MFTRVLRSPDADGGGGFPATATYREATADAPAAVVHALGGPDGAVPDLRRCSIEAGSGVLSDETVRLMLADCCRFLRQLTVITTGVVATVDVGKFRQVVASELPVPRGVIREDGTRSLQDTPPAEAPDRDHRKNPRGRKHPLITLVQTALQGVRLLMQITSGTNPGAHNEEKLSDQREREAAKEAEKGERDALREEEKTLSKILAGKY
jgi:hypothetical protein